MLMQLYGEFPQEQRKNNRFALQTGRHPGRSGWVHLGVRAIFPQPRKRTRDKEFRSEKTFLRKAAAVLYPSQY